MRKFVTTAATAFTLGFLALSTPAMADEYQARGNYGQQGQYQVNPYQPQDSGYRNAGHQDGWQDPGAWDDRGRGDGWRRSDRDVDWGRQEGNFDRWERGWGRGGWDHDRYAAPLPYWRLVRRVEQQGYYGIRGLRESRFGGYRAFAYNFRGRPVMLRINPFNGRVLDVRYV